MLVLWLRFGVGKPKLLRSVVVLSALLFLLLILGQPLCAQNSYGALGGEVQDSTGARVPGTAVLVQASGSSVRTT